MFDGRKYKFQKKHDELAAYCKKKWEWYYFLQAQPKGMKEY